VFWGFRRDAMLLSPERKSKCIRFWIDFRL